MTAAVDTNILLDILVPGWPHGDSSERALFEALGTGAVIVAEAIYAKLSAHFPKRTVLDHFLGELEYLFIEIAHVLVLSLVKALTGRLRLFVCARVVNAASPDGNALIVGGLPLGTFLQDSTPGLSRDPHNSPKGQQSIAEGWHISLPFASGVEPLQLMPPSTRGP